MPDRYRVEKWKQVHAPNGAMLRLEMERSGYRVFQWSDNPGQVYGLHKHGESQSHWIISGKLEISVERVGTFLLEAGDRDFMPAETYHSARVIGDEAVLYLVGELTPAKKTRGRPKKSRSAVEKTKTSEDEIPDEIKNLIGRFF